MFVILQSWIYLHVLPIEDRYSLGHPYIDSSILILKLKQLFQFFFCFLIQVWICARMGEGRSVEMRHRTRENTQSMTSLQVFTIWCSLSLILCLFLSFILSLSLCLALFLGGGWLMMKTMYFIKGPLKQCISLS